MPIYCTRFTAGLIKLKLEEHQLVKSTKLITVEAVSYTHLDVYKRQWWGTPASLTRR